MIRAGGVEWPTHTCRGRPVYSVRPDGRASATTTCTAVGTQTASAQLKRRVTETIAPSELEPREREWERKRGNIERNCSN